jgi:hypothetical protein
LRASNDSGDAIVATASERLFYAVLFAIVEDGLVASSTSLRAHAGAVTSLLAGLEASCFMALPLALAAAPVAWLLDRPTSRVLGRHLRAGLAAGEPENEGTGVVLYSLALAVGAVLTWQLGMRIGELQSTRVATLATLAVALFAMGASALVSTLLVGRAGKLLHRLPARLRAPPPWLPVPGVLVTLAGVAALYWFLPSSHAITPAAALVGFFLGPEIGSRIVEGPARVRAPVALLFGASVLLTAGASIALPRLPDAAKLGVLTRAPYASLLITTIRRLFDRDHDGYSPILGGGDCNDHDPAIHPHALDLPGNGIDENCSGADAHPFVPQPQPPASVPPIAGAPRRYNVVLVHVEAVRPDHMSMNGYRRPTTPRIDRFKEGAVWFRNAYSTAPSTRFALSQIFTGLEVPRIPQKRGSGVDYWLLPEATTLAERLAPAGYDTVGYTLSYVLQHIHDVGQGFREWTTPWRVDEWKETYHDASELTTNAALEYLKATPQDGTKPYLLFLHYGATHDPYIKGERGLGLRRRADRSVRQRAQLRGRAARPALRRARCARRQGPHGRPGVLGPRGAVRRARLHQARQHAVPARRARDAAREDAGRGAQGDRRADRAVGPVGHDSAPHWSAARPQVAGVGSRPVHAGCADAVEDALLLRRPVALRRPLREPRRPLAR